MDVRLPIDVVVGPNRTPHFKWTQAVDTPAGKRVVEHEGPLPPTVEVAVARLIAVAKQLLMDNAALKGTIMGLNERLAAQEAGTIQTKRVTTVERKGK